MTINETLNTFSKISKIPERIHFKVLSSTYNSLQYSQPRYLRDLFTIQPTRSTRSSSILALSRPPVTTHLKFSNRAISNTAPRLWNDLPPEFRTFSVPQPSSPITHHHPHQAPLSITAKAFHSKLKSLLFKNSYPDSTDHLPSNSRPKRHPPYQLLWPLWSSGNRTRTSSYYSFGQPFWLDAALVNKLVLCAWLSSGALEVWRLRLRLRL